MPSPFPGMNPYFERPAVWQDFHHRYQYALAAAITARTRPQFVARINEHLYIRDAWAEDLRPAGVGDVTVSRRGPTPATGPAVAATVAAPVSVRVPATIDLERMAYLEVIDRDNEQVVTVVEVLSPSNKRSGQDRVDYLAKRRRLLRSDVNLVEIDLLRGFPRMPAEGLGPCDYCILISRAEDRPVMGAWPLRLRDPLPTIPLPLRPGVPEPEIDLQAALNRVYDEADYKLFVYHGTPEPPLPPSDAEWARAIAAAEAA